MERKDWTVEWRTVESETLGADKCSRFNTALTPQFIKIQNSRKFFLPNHHPVPILNRRRMVRLKPVTLTRNNRSLFMCFGEVNRLDTTVIKAHVEPVSGSKKNSDRLFFSSLHPRIQFFSPQIPHWSLFYQFTGTISGETLLHCLFSG